jgi:glucosyl-3-phosphoglycerate synthase
MRIHRNQTTASLGKMSFGILHTFLSRAEKYGSAQLLRELGGCHIALEREDLTHSIKETEIPTVERPPMIEIAEYREKFKKG